MKYTLLGVLAFLMLELQAQDSSILFRVGLSTYSMREQKTFQENFRLANRVVPLRVVHEFPNFYHFGGSLSVKASTQSSVGIWYEYNSTGGRLHYSDYSGFAYLNQLLRSSQLGCFAQHKIAFLNEWTFAYITYASLVLTYEELASAIQVGQNLEKETLSFRSKHFSIRPTVSLNRKFNFLLLQAEVGYDLQTRGQLKTTNDFKLVDSNGDAVGAQWDGLRFTACVGFLLSSKKQKAP